MRTLELGRIYPNLESTQETLKTWIRSDANIRSGVWVSCDQQIAGRGRRGSAWISADGNLFLSVAVMFETWGPLPLLAIESGLWIHEWVSSLVRVPVSIKWPNDIEIEGRKVAGILGESFRSHGKIWAVIGVGLNIVKAPPLQDRSVAALSEWLDVPPSLDDARIAVSEAIRNAATRLENGGFSFNRIEAVLSFKKGDLISWRASDGSLKEGIFFGLNRDGSLEVSRAGSSIALMNEEVFQVRQKL